MSAEKRFAQMVSAATALQEQRRWLEAGGAWVEAGRVAVDAKALPSARQVLGLAGEAFRRDDRLVDAARALRLALSYGPDPVEAVGLQVRLAGLCGELGAWEEGLDRCSRAADSAVRAGLLPVVLDTWAGLALAHRPKAEARVLVERLAASGGDAGFAVSYRRAQLARLDGELDLARASAERLLRQLSGRDGAESGLGAARAELAELDLLEGRPLAALAACEEARREHEAAGRRGPALRAEAARVRAAVEAGLEVFPGPLVDGAAFAEARGLRMLAIDLAIATGAATARRDPPGARRTLERAVREADAVRAPLSAGRARWYLARVVEDPRPVLERAAVDFTDHAPMLARVKALL